MRFGLFWRRWFGSSEEPWPTKATITHGPEALAVVWCFSDGSQSEHHAEWKNVQRITAFKRDLVTLDMICLVIGLSDRAFEIDEDMEGYASLIGALPQYLAGASPYEEWFEKVAKPAFATNATVIYSRD